jgi:hypothetical protein
LFTVIFTGIVRMVPRQPRHTPARQRKGVFLRQGAEGLEKGSFARRTEEVTYNPTYQELRAAPALCWSSHVIIGGFGAGPARPRKAQISQPEQTRPRGV